jgi:hypothetical protein
VYFIAVWSTYFTAIWYILWPFRIFCGHFVYFVAILYTYFVAILYILWLFGIFSVWVCCVKKNLATLLEIRILIIDNFFFSCQNFFSMSKLCPRDLSLSSLLFEADDTIAIS